MARIAAGDGLDYIQLADAWEPTFKWLSAEELNKMAREATTKHVVVGWNTETPKCYMSEDDGGEKGNLHCYGHGCPVGLKDISKGWEFFHTGPNFRIIQEIHRQGAVVGCAHPMRFWFNKGNFVSNWASELPFDFVAGAGYDSIDILNDAPILFFESERLWWNLLNMGYKVPGTGNSDGNLGAERGVGRFRTYTKISGEFSWDKIADGIRKGACVASSGPFVLFDVDGQDSGAEFPADGKMRKASIRAWSSPLPGETLLSVQIVRNGEVVRAWDLHGQNLRDWKTATEIGDGEFAWYAVRVLSTCRERSSARWQPGVYELAVASPVYFLPAHYQRPKPAIANVALTLVDGKGNPLSAQVTVIDADTELNTVDVPASGIATFPAPPTASLRIRSPGRPEQIRSIYMDSELFDYCRNMNTVWPSFFSPETFTELREMLGRLKVKITI